MKNYKDYGTVNLGRSNNGNGLVVKCGKEVKWLQFDSEGPYKAYVVDEEAMIADHYHREMTFSAPCEHYISVSTFDDEGHIFETPRCKDIDIYRAGKSVCLIRIRRQYRLGGSPINEDEED